VCVKTFSSVQTKRDVAPGEQLVESVRGHSSRASDGATSIQKRTFGVGDSAENAVSRLLVDTVQTFQQQISDVRKFSRDSINYYNDPCVCVCVCV